MPTETITTITADTSGATTVTTNVSSGMYTIPSGFYSTFISTPMDVAADRPTFTFSRAEYEPPAPIVQKWIKGQILKSMGDSDGYTIAGDKVRVEHYNELSQFFRGTIMGGVHAGIKAYFNQDEFNKSEIKRNLPDWF